VKKERKRVKDKREERIVSFSYYKNGKRIQCIYISVGDLTSTRD